MKLGVEAGLDPGHIVLDRDPAPSKKGHSPLFRPCLLRPNGWMDQNATWYRGRPRPRWHCVRWGPAPGHRPPPSKKGGARPQFSVHVHCGQTVAHLSNCWALVYFILDNAGFRELTFNDLMHAIRCWVAIEHRLYALSVESVAFEIQYSHQTFLFWLTRVVGLWCCLTFLSNSYASE